MPPFCSSFFHFSGIFWWKFKQCNFIDTSSVAPIGVRRTRRTGFYEHECFSTWVLAQNLSDILDKLPVAGSQEDTTLHWHGTMLGCHRRYVLATATFERQFHHCRRNAGHVMPCHLAQPSAATQRSYAHVQRFWTSLNSEVTVILQHFVVNKLLAMAKASDA